MRRRNMDKRRTLKKIFILTLLTLSFSKIKAPISCLLGNEISNNVSNNWPKNKKLNLKFPTKYPAALNLASKIFKNNNIYKLKQGINELENKISKLKNSKEADQIFLDSLKKNEQNRCNIQRKMKSEIESNEIKMRSLYAKKADLQGKLKDIQEKSNFRNIKPEKEKKIPVNKNQKQLLQENVAVLPISTNLKNNEKNKKNSFNKIFENNGNSREITLINENIKHLKENKIKDISYKKNIKPNTIYNLKDTENKNSVKNFTPNKQYYVKDLRGIRNQKNLKPNFNFNDKDNIKNTNMKNFTSEEKNIVNNMNNNLSKNFEKNNDEKESGKILVFYVNFNEFDAEANKRNMKKRIKEQIEEYLNNIEIFESKIKNCREEQEKIKKNDIKEFFKLKKYITYYKDRIINLIEMFWIYYNHEYFKEIVRENKELENKIFSVIENNKEYMQILNEKYTNIVKIPEEIKACVNKIKINKDYFEYYSEDSRFTETCEKVKNIKNGKLKFTEKDIINFEKIIRENYENICYYKENFYKAQLELNYLKTKYDKNINQVSRNDIEKVIYSKKELENEKLECEKLKLNYKEITTCIDEIKRFINSKKQALPQKNTVLQETNKPDKNQKKTFFNKYIENWMY